MFRTVLEISCMMCGTQVGEVRDRRFFHHQGCERQLEIRGGFLRCCRCGGSLYQERADSLVMSPRSQAAALHQEQRRAS